MMMGEVTVLPDRNEIPAVHVVTHAVAEKHDPGPGHPESPERLKTVLELLRSQEDVHVSWCSANLADRKDVEVVHSGEYLDQLHEVNRMGGGALDSDTVMNSASHEAAYRAAGAAIQAARLACEGKPAFAAVRPPGHHACRSHAMGFCLLNNVVIAARKMIEVHGLNRVLIVDWDVHHGNGTQELVETDKRIRYVSMHQHPYFPGTGGADERGVGNIFNVPRPGASPLTDMWLT
jgi:acetoin utilization deacetylase AcuC-like enzyme